MSILGLTPSASPTTLALHWMADQATAMEVTKAWVEAHDKHSHRLHIFKQEFSPKCAYCAEARERNEVA